MTSIDIYLSAHEGFKMSAQSSETEGATELELTFVNGLKETIEYIQERVEAKARQAPPPDK